MRNALQLLGGVAVAGVVAAGSTAFTATGLTNGAGSTQYIGGTVTQSVTGATLNSVHYTFSDAPVNLTVSYVTLTFNEAALDTKPVTVVATASPNTMTFTCTAVGAVGTFDAPNQAATTKVAYCTAGVSFTGLSSIAITV